MKKQTKRKKLFYWQIEKIDKINFFYVLERIYEKKDKYINAFKRKWI